VRKKYHTGGNVDLTEFPLEEKPFDTDGEMTENAELGPDPDTSESPDEDEPKQDGRPEGKPRGDFGSEQELFEAYKLADRRAVEQASEAANYKRMLDQLGQNTRRLLRQTDEDAFVKEMRDSYAKDPVAAITKMIGRAQQETLGHIDARMSRSAQDQQEFGRLMDEFLDYPANSGLKTYRNELEFLIRERRLFPDEAADLIRRVHSKGNSSAKRRSDAADDIRTRSAVESGGDTSPPTDRDQQLYKIMKKAKTLDEMFAGLRKMKY
jgi:hypothetical protein